MQAGETLCVESYVGEVGGPGALPGELREGVKLEQQVLITGTGALPLATSPFEEQLLGRGI